MSHPRLLIIIAAIIVAVVALAVRSAQSGEKKVFLTGYDVLAQPGDVVALQAKAEKASNFRFRPDLDDEVIEFYRDGKLIGSAKTDDDGKATVQYKVETAGRFTVEARLPEKSKYTAGPAPILIDVCDAKTEFIVCDIDHTIADISATKFIITKNKDVPALPGSPEVLARVAKRYKIIYITARDDTFTRKTRHWMALNKFPAGPVFFWDFLGKKLSHTKYKTRQIAAIKKRFPNLVTGMGDRVGDAKAYLANGLKAVIVGDERDDDLPRAAIFVKSWKDAEPHLLPKK
jgi:hypothetical protein